MTTFDEIKARHKSDDGSAAADTKRRQYPNSFYTMAHTDRAALIAMVERLREALKGLYDHTAEYITINNLGDIHNTDIMRRAGDILAAGERS